MISDIQLEAPGLSVNAYHIRVDDASDTLQGRKHNMVIEFNAQD
jgi:hypothetical protein